MGLDIKALKIKQRLGDKPTDEIVDRYDDYDYVYTLDFSPIVHLPKIKEGVYETENAGKHTLSMSYGGYSVFREAICRMVYNKDFLDVVTHAEQYIGKPFIEFLDFADNEGSFDYEVASKLHKDFLDFQDKASSFLDDYHFECYKTYMAILKEVVDVKGVIFYY